MAVFVVLLRAVNVGGTGKLPMADLKAMCVSSGFSRVQTYIASGNMVLETTMTAGKVKSVLEKRLEAYAENPVGVVVRSLKDMAAVLKSNPFPQAAPNRTVAIFLPSPAPANALENVTGRKDEDIRVAKNEIYVHYGDGMGASKLKIPAARAGTARNMNTVAKLVELATVMQQSA